MLRRNYDRIFDFIFLIPFLRKPFPRDPFSKTPLGDRSRYLDIYYDSLNIDDTDIKNFEKKSGFSIDLNWLNDLALHTQVCIKQSRVNFQHGRILYSKLSRYLNDLNNNSEQIIILETGTARGFSSICMAKAIIDSNYKGIISTIDCLPHNKKIYWNCIDDCSGKKTRGELLSKWKKELSMIIFIQGWTNISLDLIGVDRINFAFLDAQHTKNNVLNEFFFVSKHQLKGDIVVFDDVTQGLFDGVCEAVKYIEKNLSYDIEYLNFSKDRRYAIACKK